MAPESNDESESTQADVDPFEELGVEHHLPGDHSGDGLDAFMDDDDEEGQIEENQPEPDTSEEEDDDDLFAALGVAGPAVQLASAGPDDILSAFMDDDEEEVEQVVEEPSSAEKSPSAPDAKEAYRMVLETVWVDGILDPGEVNLLARRREELNLSFVEHLELVRQMLG